MQKPVKVILLFLKQNKISDAAFLKITDSYNSRFQGPVMSCKIYHSGILMKHSLSMFVRGVFWTQSNTQDGKFCYSSKSSRSQISFKIGALENFTIFTGKYLSRGLFLIKLQACNLIKKRSQHRCFPVNIEKFSRTPIFIEHLW